MENAFNELSRDRVIEATTSNEHMRGFPLFYIPDSVIALHHAPIIAVGTDARNKTETATITATRGLRQGEVFSSLLYCLAIHERAWSIGAFHDDLINTASIPPCSIMLPRSSSAPTSPHSYPTHASSQIPSMTRPPLRPTEPVTDKACAAAPSIVKSSLVGIPGRGLELEAVVCAHCKAGEGCRRV
jgi:hypothetical protein